MFFSGYKYFVFYAAIRYRFVFHGTLIFLLRSLGYACFTKLTLNVTPF